LGQPSSNLSFEDWFEWNVRHNSDDNDWPTNFLITLWFIWKWHNGVYFDGTILSVQTKVGILQNKYKEHRQAMHAEVAGQSSQPHHEMGFIRWELAPEGWNTLNTDGASKGNPGLAGCGGVLRDDRGEWQWGFAMNMGFCSSIKAELMAVLKGLQVAKDRGVQKLWIKSDSRVHVGMLLGDYKANPEHGVLIKHCKDLLRDSSWETEITHCFREANKVADKLANLGVNLDGAFMLFVRPPREVLDDLFSDVVGVAWPRMIRR